jgi:hypothetical protein
MKVRIRRLRNMPRKEAVVMHCTIALEAWLSALLYVCFLVPGASRAVAGTQYVLVNNNNSIANSVFMYRLDKKSGRLHRALVLHTGGKGWGQESDLSGVEQAISADASCIFGLNIMTSDIAAFSKATGYQRVGTYFDQNLISNVYGDSIALSPDGRFLFASYTATGNIGAWRVNSDCSLTSVNRSGAETGVGPLQVTPDGKFLLARAGGGVFDYSIDPVTGSITQVSIANFRTGACARESACTPYGIQITRDGKLAVFQSYAPDARRLNIVPLILTARITSQGLTNPTVRNLPIQDDLRAGDFPFLSAGAYEGSGTVYLGVFSNAGQSNPGVLTADFTEKPVHFAVTNSTVVQPQVGNIAVTGNVMVIAQYPNQIGVFRIQKNGSLKLLSTTTIDEQGEGLFSLSIFPNTR